MKWFQNNFGSNVKNWKLIPASSEFIVIIVWNWYNNNNELYNFQIVSNQFSSGCTDIKIKWHCA
jgi:hypothetical protein